MKLERLKAKILRKSELLSLVTSLMLHVSIYVAIDYLVSCQNIPKGPMRIGKASGKASSQAKRGSQVEIVVIRSMDRAGIKKKVKAGYWGIGIEVTSFAPSINYNGRIYPGELITKIFNNYPADKAGLMVGDAIIMVDDDELDMKSIRGIGPAKLKLTVFRNGKIFNVLVDREEIMVESP